MALEAFFLEVAVCPDTRQALKLADAELLTRLNAAVEKKKLKDRSQSVVEPKLGAALVRSDGTLVYPVWDDVPRLVSDAAIPLDQLD